MKIAFFLTGPSGGGAERAMILVANHIAQHSDHTVDMVLGRINGPNYGLIDKSVNIFDLHAGKARKMLFPLSRYVKDSRPDVLVSSLMVGDLLALCGKRLMGWETKLLISVQNHPLAHAQGATTLLQRYWPWLISRLYSGADRIVAISTGVSWAVAGLLNRTTEQIQVIYNPTVSPGFPEKLAEKPDHPWFYEKTQPVILAAGRLNRQKDFPTLIKAFSILRKDTAAKLIILGEGEERQKLERFASDLGLGDHVAMPGYLSNPYPWMKHADLFVLSSLWEGFANVVAESLACGTPVVSTDCPSGPAEILSGEEYGLLVPVNDPDALAVAMRSALRRTFDRERLVARGMVFDIDNIAPKYQKLIVELAVK